MLDRAVSAYADAEPGEQPWLYWVRPHDQAQVQRSIGRVELAAGYGKAAYERLAPVLGTLPPERPRSTGELHFHLAKAALLMGEPRQAVDHITEAYRAFDSVGAPLSSGQVSRVQKQLVDRFGDEAGKDLGERLRTTTNGGEDCRYRLARSYTGRRRQRLHQRDCSYLRRFETSLARGWPEGEGREPGELAVDPLIRARFDVCTRCMRG